MTNKPTPASQPSPTLECKFCGTTDRMSNPCSGPDGVGHIFDQPFFRPSPARTPDNGEVWRAIDAAMPALADYHCPALLSLSKGDKEIFARAVIAADRKYTGQSSPAQANNRVPVPQNADQAHGMAMLGMAYLKEYAPERLQPSPAPCTRCNGEGRIDTGIDESPTTLCNKCNGTGEQPSPARSDKDAERLDAALATFLAEHTRLSQDGIDECAACMALALNDVANDPVPESDIAEWYEQGIIAAKAQESAPSGETIEVSREFLRGIRAVLMDAQYLTVVDELDEVLARRATAGNAAPEPVGCIKCPRDPNKRCDYCGYSFASNAGAAPGNQLAHGHRDDWYLMANARRIGMMPIRQVANMTNWSFAHELFATGSNSSHQICVDAGIDPAGYTVERAPSKPPVGAKEKS